MHILPLMHIFIPLVHIHSGLVRIRNGLMHIRYGFFMTLSLTLTTEVSH